MAKKDVAASSVDSTFEQSPEVQKKIQEISDLQKENRKTSFMSYYKEKFLRTNSLKELQKKEEDIDKHGVSKTKREMQKENSQHKARERFDPKDGIKPKKREDLRLENEDYEN